MTKIKLGCRYHLRFNDSSDDEYYIEIKKVNNIKQTYLLKLESINRKLETFNLTYSFEEVEKFTKNGDWIITLVSTPVGLDEGLFSM